MLLTEDTVRSAAAYELSRLKTEENFKALREATKQRASPGLVSALGEYERSESIPILFELLENELCTNEALRALRKVPVDAGAYAILLLRGQTGLQIEGPTAVRRRRNTEALERIRNGQRLRGRSFRLFRSFTLTSLHHHCDGHLSPSESVSPCASTLNVKSFFPSTSLIRKT